MSNQWVYRVVSDKPLGIWNGIGNGVMIAPSEVNPIRLRDQPRTVTSGPQAAPATVTLELTHRPDQY